MAQASNNTNDPMKAQLASLSEVRLAMQRVINEQKLILARHQSAKKQESPPATRQRPSPRSSPTTYRPPLPSSSVPVTPLRQATTRISPIQSNVPKAYRSPADLINSATLQAHEHKISSLKKQYEDLQQSMNVATAIHNTSLTATTASQDVGAAHAALVEVQLKSANSTIETLQKREATLQNEVAHVRADNLRLRGTIAQQNEQLQRSQDKFQKVTQDHADLDEQHNKLLIQAKASLQTQITSLNKQLSERNQDISTLKLQLSQKTLAISDLTAELQRVKQAKEEEITAVQNKFEQETEQVRRRNKELNEALEKSQLQLTRLVDLHKTVRLKLFVHVCFEQQETLPT